MGKPEGGKEHFKEIETGHVLKLEYTYFSLNDNVLMTHEFEEIW